MEFSGHRSPEREGERSPSFSAQETKLVTSILDIEAQTDRDLSTGVYPGDALERLDTILARTDADAAEDMIRQGISQMEDERMEDLADEAGSPIDARFENHLNRASRTSHAIQCSVNKAFEMGLLLDALDTTTSEAAQDVTPDSTFVRNALDRQKRMNETMSEIYVADILRRIALRTGDEETMLLAKKRFDASREDALALIVEFATAQPERIAAVPGLHALLEKLTLALEETDEDAFKESVYTDVATPFSMMIGYDLEDFNEQEIREALARMVST